MKKLLFIVIGILIGLIVLSVFKDVIAKVSVEKGVELVTGLRLRIQSFRVGLINTLVGIKNFRLFNPKGFKDKIMLNMPEIYVDYNLPAIFKGKIHLEEMRINMEEFMVVKNENGELNLDSLKVVQAQKEGKKPSDKAKAPEIQIDTLELRIGKVIYKDYSRGGEPSVKEFNVNLNERYENISNPYALVSLIVVKALMNTTIASLANFDLKGLQGTISDTLATAQKVVAETAEKAKEAVKVTTEKAKEVAKETTQKTQETVKKTTETLKETFKLPFGAEEK